MGRSLLLAAALLAALLISPEPLAAADRATVEQAIEKALDGPARLECVAKPLWDVVDHLKDACGVEIQIDNVALFEAGIDPSEVRITRDVKRVSLRSALGLLLRDVGLTFVVEDEVVLITTPEAASERLTTRLYPVGDLIASPDAMERQRRRQALVATITASIDPASWQAAGGLGSALYSELSDGPALVVSQSYAVHRRIGQFLESQRMPAALVREAAAALRGTPGKTIYRVGVSVAEEKAAEKIEKALAQPTEFDFHEVPLSKVVAYFSERHQMNIVIDRRALEDVGVDASTIPVTQRANGVTLRSALRVLMRDCDLTTMITDEVLLITTPEEAECRLEVRVYVVGDLAGTRLAAGQTPGGYSADYGRSAFGGPRAGLAGQTAVAPGADALGDIVCRTIEPLCWEVTGGPGSIVAFSIDGTDALIVSNTGDVHERIANLLDQLRGIRSPAAPAGDADDSRPPEEHDPLGAAAGPFGPQQTPKVPNRGNGFPTDPFGR